MTITTALFRAFIGAFMIGLGVGVAFGFIMRFVKSIVSVND